MDIVDRVYKIMLLEVEYTNEVFELFDNGWWNSLPDDYIKRYDINISY